MRILCGVNFVNPTFCSKEQAVKKPVIMKLGEIYLEFESPQEASDYTKVPKTTIRRACAYNNGRPIRNGMIFIYKQKTVPLGGR